MSDKKTSVYAKLAEARKTFHALDLKKSGENKFAKYKYFELGDFVQPGLEAMREAGLIPIISFDDAYATMTIHETDGTDNIVITSPMSTADLKGSHPVQCLGAVQTYMRRYLWMAALEIVEHDAVDASKPAEAPEKINESQVADIEALMQDVGADAPRFMRWLRATFGAGDLSEITVDMHPKVVGALEKKRAA